MTNFLYPIYNRKLRTNGSIKDRVSHTNWYVYVLALESDKFYVGIAIDPNKRFEEHKLQGKGSASFCKKYKPKAIIEILDTGTNIMNEACKFEDKITIQYMDKHGSANVRGGRFFGNDRRVLNKYLAS